jgi:hypothetical protein
LLIKSLKFTFKKTGKQKRIQIFLGTTTDLITQPSADKLLTFNDVPETTFVEISSLETSTAELIFSTETTSTSSTTTTYTTTPPKVKSLKKRHWG